MAQAPPSSQRIQWIDVARGIGIVLVVFGHVERGLFSSGITHDYGLELADRVIYLFHMPLFFFLAGLTVTNGLGRGRLIYIKSKIITVAYPYFLWSVLQASATIAMSRHANAQIDVGDLLQIGWKPLFQFWFLYALFLCQVGFALIPRMPSAWLGFGIFALGLALQIFPSGGVFFNASYGFLFMVLGASGGAELISGRWHLAISASAFLGLICLALARDVRPFSVESIPAGIAGVALIVIVSKMATGRLAAIFAHLGSLSMPIYVMHVVPAAALRALLTGVEINDWRVHLGAEFVAGIGIPICANYALGQIGLLPWLGLARATRRKKVETSGRSIRPASTISQIQPCTDPATLPRDQ